MNIEVGEKLPEEFWDEMTASVTNANELRFQLKEVLGLLRDERMVHKVSADEMWNRIYKSIGIERPDRDKYYATRNKHGEWILQERDEDNIYRQQ